MKKAFVITIFLAITAPLAWSQANAPWNTENYKKLLLTPNSAYVKDEIKKRKPIVLPPIREADAVWSMMIWRVIDVREKMNQQFYYPQENVDGRNNLMNVLLNGIKDYGLTAYETTDDQFNTPISYEDIMKKLDAGEEVIQVRNQLTGELEDKVVANTGSGSAEILQYMLKEQWYFDRNTSTLQVRIIGICPIRVYQKEADFVQDLEEEENDYNTTQEPKLRQKLFWIYFPEARPLLATQEAFSRQNDSHRLSYDDVFIKRYFSSFIAQASNMYDNRAIADYKKGLDQILESERIKEEILRFENDLWEY